jgi:hypothetical protein
MKNVFVLFVSAFLVAGSAVATSQTRPATAKKAHAHSTITSTKRDVHWVRRRRSTEPFQGWRTQGNSLRSQGQMVCPTTSS